MLAMLLPFVADGVLALEYFSSFSRLETLP